MRRLASVSGAWLALLALALAVAPVLAQWWAARAAPPQPVMGWGAPPAPGWESPDTLVVDLRDGAAPAQVQGLAARIGALLAPVSAPGAGTQIYRTALHPAALPAALAALRRDPLVEAVDREHYYVCTWTPNDERFAEQWNFRMVGAEKAWDTTRGQGVVVAVIDTGVAFEQDERCYLARDFKETPFVRGYDFIHKDDHPNDDHGHGTHVAGTISETTNNREGVTGLAFEAKVMPIKVLTKDGWGRSGDIAEAIRWAADHGAHIINMSLGGPLPDLLMQNACKYAHSKGVTIVCAAGNTGSGRVGYPAAFKECIAVSAVGPKGEITRYSSWGKQIAIAAPGGDTSEGQQFGILQNTVLGGNDDYYFFQGTSMASPHVAAAAALVRTRGVKDPEAIRKVLQKSATPKQPAEKYGAGLLNAANAVQEADVQVNHKRAMWGLALAPLAAYALLGLLRRRTLSGTVLGVAVALGLGFAGPDLISAWLGEGSRWNLLGHSALIPALLLVGVEAGGLRAALGALAAGAALHLGWDAWHQMAPIPEVTAWTTLPWLGVNGVLGIVLCTRAWRKG